MATRISLIRSARQREQREQIGTLLTPFAQSLIEIEKQCLIRLSAAARNSNQVQIALNSIVRAQGLEDHPTFEVSQEFANVLWLQKEQKLAVQFLSDLVERSGRGTSSELSQANTASLLARLVCYLYNIVNVVLPVFQGYMDVGGMSQEADRYFDTLFRACHFNSRWVRNAVHQYTGVRPCDGLPPVRYVRRASVSCNCPVARCNQVEDVH
jgi:hypothetical protein